MKFFSKRGKTTARASSVPVLYFTQSSARKLQRFTDGLSRRVIEGRAMFIVELAGILRSQIQQHAPKIQVGSEMYDYARDLRLSMIEGLEDADAVCLWHKGLTVLLDEGDLPNTVLYIKPKLGSPPWVHTLTIYGPWPASLLPVDITGVNALVVARTVRPDEIAELERRIIGRKAAIEGELARNGQTSAKIQRTRHAMNVAVHEDLAWHVLRVEFGYAEQPMLAHWRPAIRAMMECVDDVLEKYLDYIMTANNRFDLPHDADLMMSEIQAERLASSGHFMQELAPFVPKG